MKKLLALLVLLPALALGQTFPDGNVVYFAGTADPTGACLVGTEFYRTDTGDRFSCVDGTWGAYAGGTSFPLLAPDGTDAAPSYSFTNNTDMGCRRPSANSFWCQNSATQGGVDHSYLSLSESSWSLTRKASTGEDYSINASSPTSSVYVRTNGVEIFTFGNSTVTTTVPIVYEGTSNDTTLSFTDPSADRAIVFPDKAGTVAMTSDIGGGTRVTLASDDASVVATPGENLALGFTPANSTTYAITGRYYHNTTATSTGEIVGVDWPTSDTLVGTCTFFGANSLTATKIMAQVAASGTATSTFYTSTVTLDQPRVTTIECVFTTGTNTSGDFTFRTGVETLSGSPTTTVYAGTWFEYEALP